MKALSPTIRRRLLPLLVFVCAGVIVLMPLHAFLTVWAASLAGHYTVFRLWKELLLVLLVIGSGIIAWSLRSRPAAGRQWYRRWPLLTVTVAYLAVLGISGLISYLTGGVTAKAAGYGLLLDSRFLIFFLVVWLISHYGSWISAHWRVVVLIPAVIVVIFGILQYTVLPDRKSVV